MYQSFNIFSYSISTYGLFMVVGLIAAFTISAVRTKRNNLSIDHLLIIISFVLIGVLLGAKALYIAVTYNPSDFWKIISSGNLSVLFSGGLVYYGGLLGGVLFAVLGAKFAQTTLQPYINIVTPSIPIAHGLGRIGCYLAGCCYGFPYEGLLASKHMISEDDIIHIVSSFPVQLIEAAINIILGIVLLLLSKKHRISLSLYFICYAVIRFILEFLRGDIERGTFGIFSTSQWVSVILIAAVAGWNIIRNLRTHKSVFGGIK